MYTIFLMATNIKDYVVSKVLRECEYPLKLTMYLRNPRKYIQSLRTDWKIIFCCLCGTPLDDLEIDEVLYFTDGKFKPQFKSINIDSWCCSNPFVFTPPNININPDWCSPYDGSCIFCVDCFDKNELFKYIKITDPDINGGILRFNEWLDDEEEIKRISKYYDAYKAIKNLTNNTFLFIYFRMVKFF